jgi:predicted  nucleic acid-binding Zn-ribbon protein
MPKYKLAAEVRMCRSEVNTLQQAAAVKPRASSAGTQTEPPMTTTTSSETQTLSPLSVSAGAQIDSQLSVGSQGQSQLQRSNTMGSKGPSQFSRRNTVSGNRASGNTVSSDKGSGPNVFQGPKSNDLVSNSQHSSSMVGEVYEEPEPIFVHRESIRSSTYFEPNGHDEQILLGEPPKFTEAEMQAKINTAVAETKRRLEELLVENADLGDAVSQADATAQDAMSKSDQALRDIYLMEEKMLHLQEKLNGMHVMMNAQKNKHVAHVQKIMSEADRVKSEKDNLEKEIKAHARSKIQAENELQKALEQHHLAKEDAESVINQKAEEIKRLQRDISKLRDDDARKAEANAFLTDELRQMEDFVRGLQLAATAEKVELHEKEKLLEENIQGYHAKQEEFQKNKDELQFLTRIFSRVFETKTNDGHKLTPAQAETVVDKCMGAVSVRKDSQGYKVVTFDTNALATVRFD